jgi:predicted nucleic acid-binding protein
MSVDVFPDTNVSRYSEDLNNGQLYGRVQVVNPFLS